MKRIALASCMGIGLWLLGSSGWAQGPCAPCLPPNPFQPRGTPSWTAPPLDFNRMTPGSTPSGQQGTGQTPSSQGTTEQGQTGQGQTGQGTDMASNAQAEAGERGTEASYDGPMFGDIIVPAFSFQSSVSPALAAQAASLAAATGAHPGAASPGVYAGGGGFAGATFPFHSAFKISENEIPRPVNRVYAMYNYYSDVAGSGLAYGASGAQVHRELFGGEKTFLNGNASVGVRLPVFQTFGTGTVASAQLGDTSLVFKYALYNNRRSFDVLTIGMVFTFPTGKALKVPGQSSINSTYFQPWIGGIWHIGNLYFMDFTSIAIASDARDINFFFESLAAGYLIYRNTDRNAFLRAIVPDAEFHVNAPFNHQSLTSTPIGFPPTVDFTGGCLFFLGKSILAMGAGTPMTGPRPYGFEALVSLNYFF